MANSMTIRVHTSVIASHAERAASAIHDLSKALKALKITVVKPDGTEKREQ
jgi:hypothetical protein